MRPVIMLRNRCNLVQTGEILHLRHAKYLGHSKELISKRMQCKTTHYLSFEEARNKAKCHKI